MSILGRYVPGTGSYSAKLMVIAEAPGYYEVATDNPRPLIGPSGKLFDAICQDAGISRSEIYITNIIKYRPPENKLKNLPNIGITNIETQCMPEVIKELQAIKPNTVLALGETALNYLTGLKGITNYRGSILNSRFPNILPKVIPSIHPAALLHSKDQQYKKFPWSAKTYITLDYKRAYEESKTNFINLPSRLLEVCRNSYQLYQFIEKYKNCEKLSVDIEVIKCIPVCIGLAFNSSHAISVPLINITGPENKNFYITHSELAIMWKFVAKLLETKKIIGQNFKFDHEKLRNVCSFVINNVYSDVMFKAHCLHSELPKRLAFTASIYTREPYYKDEGKEFDFRKHSMDRFYLYNAKDAAVTFEIDEKMEDSIKKLGIQDFYYNQLMPLHNIYMDIEQTGFEVDLNKREELIKKYNDWENSTQASLNFLAGHEVNYRSPIQVKKLLYGELGVPSRADVSEETLCALLVNVVKDTKIKQIIEDIYSLRRIHTAKKGIKARLDYDGKMRTSINIVGTETGRRTTGILDPPVRPDKLGFPFQLISKHGDYGTDVRYMYRPPKGMIFQNFDLSQAEARIVALLSNDDELLKLFDTIDVHALTAQWIFGGKYEDHTKNKETGYEPTTRFGGKTVRHACNYDMKKHTLAMDVAVKARRFHIDIKMSESEANKHILSFHKKSLKVKNVFHADVRKAITDNRRVLFNPYGRRRIFLDQMGDSLYREAYAQIPQSTVGDHTAGALIRIKKRIPWLEIILESHDAILVQNYENQSDEVRSVVKEEFEREIDFSRCSLKRNSLKIPCDCEVGYNYKDMRKYKIS